MENKVILRFKRDELLYDISNCSFIEGDLMQEQEEHAKHQVFDIAENGNIDRVKRVLNLAYYECIEMLYPYTKRAVNYTEKNNLLQNFDEYEIKLKLPDMFSETTIDLLKDLIHEYMVSRVIADWLSITKPNSQSNWESKRLASKEQISKIVLFRRSAIKRPLKPF